MDLGTRLYLTLYIQIKISWKCLFSRLSISAHFSSFSYATAVLLKRARRARPWTLSSFLVSTALQKCETVRDSAVGEIW